MSSYGSDGAYWRCFSELYFLAGKEGKITTFKEAKKWLSEQERVDAPQVAARRWRAIQLQHDGQEMRLRYWRNLREQYVLLRRNVEDCNEGDEQSRLLKLLPDAWVKRVTKEDAKRAKSNHTVKMMLDNEHHKKIVNYTRAKVARDFKRQSLRTALLITVSGDCEKAAIWRLDESKVGGQTICSQAIPARMSCGSVLEWVGEEVPKEYKNLAHNRGLQSGDRSICQVGAGSDGEAVMGLAGAEGGEGLDDNEDEDETAETVVCAFWPTTCTSKATGEAGSPLSRVGRRGKRRSPAKLATRHCPLGRSSEFIHRAASSATGRDPSSNTITRRAGSTRPTRRRTRRHTGPRSLRQPTSGKPKWECPRTSSGGGDSGDQESLGS